MNDLTQRILNEIKTAEADRKHHARITPSTNRPGLSIAEDDFFSHMQRWGSDGYPVQKLAGKWFWCEAYGVTGRPSPFKTKKAAFAAVEQYLDLLRDKIAGRL